MGYDLWMAFLGRKCLSPVFTAAAFAAAAKIFWEAAFAAAAGIFRGAAFGPRSFLATGLTAMGFPFLRAQAVSLHAHTPYTNIAQFAILVNISFWVHPADRRFERAGTGPLCRNSVSGHHDSSLYIEANPLRAALVADSCDYPWSGHRCHGARHADPLPDSSPEWEQFGRTEPERRARWRRKVREEQPPRELDAVRASLRSGRPLGAEDRVEVISRGLCIALEPRRRPSATRKDQLTPDIPDQGATRCVLLLGDIVSVKTSSLPFIQ